MSSLVLNTIGGGGSKSVLLWTNSDPSASFAAQSIPADLSSYSHFAIFTRFHTSGTDMPVMIFEVDGEPKLLPVNAYTTNRTGGRTATYDDANKEIAFSGATYNGAANNAYAIPYKICGLNL